MPHGGLGDIDRQTEIRVRQPLQPVQRERADPIEERDDLGGGGKRRREADAVVAPVALEQAMGPSVLRLCDVQELLPQTVLSVGGAPSQIRIVHQIEHLECRAPVASQMLPEIIELRRTGGGRYGRQARTGVRERRRNPTFAIFPQGLKAPGEDPTPPEETTMRTTKAHFGSCGALALVGLVLGFRPAASQSPDAFTAIFDGETLDGWIVEEGASATAVDGALRVSEPEGWVRFERELSDFVLDLEFRLVTDGADSGVFVRAGTADTFGRGWPSGSYQVQLRDMHQPSRFLPLGQVYRHGLPDGETAYDEGPVQDLYRGSGEWHHLRVAVTGSGMAVALDGEEITRAEDLTSSSGYIGFQAETGIVEYRSIRLREMD